MQSRTTLARRATRSRRGRPRPGVRLVTGALLAAGLMVSTTLSAAPAGAVGRPGRSTDPATLAQSLTSRLAERTAGVYTVNGTVVVTVTDDATAALVRAAGATPRLVPRSAADLDRALVILARSARIPGTAWSVDPVSNQVLVTADESLSAPELARLTAIAAILGDAVRVERVSGTLSPAINGGRAIYGGGYRCSLGFNVRSDSTYYFLTAGHCTNLASTWYANGNRTKVLGTRAGTSFPGNDYGIVQYTNSSISHPGTVHLYGSGTQDITTARSAVVGEAVQRSGSTSGVHGGVVTGLDATVNYAEGSVSGLIRTTVCAEAGDSGGPLFAGTAALGLTSGGSGNCRTGGITYYQPVTEVLSAYGVDVY